MEETLNFEEEKKPSVWLKKKNIFNCFLERSHRFHRKSQRKHFSFEFPDFESPQFVYFREFADFW